MTLFLAKLGFAVAILGFGICCFIAGYVYGADQ